MGSSVQVISERRFGEETVSDSPGCQTNTHANAVFASFSSRALMSAMVRFHLWQVGIHAVTPGLRSAVYANLQGSLGQPYPIRTRNEWE